MKEKDNNKEETKKDLIAPEYKELKKQIDKKIDKTGYKKPNIFLKYYLVPILIGVFNILGFGLLFMFRDVLGYFFMIVLTFYIGIALPLMLGLGGYSLIRLYLDKNKLTNEIKAVLPRDFIIMYIFMTQKKLKKVVAFVNSDGISANIGESRYIIDSEKVFYDGDKYPCGFWIANLPNQLGFDFFPELDRVADKMRDDKFEIKDLYNEKGKLVDVIYSSRNLEKFRKDKVFYEFHEKTTPESMKLVYMMAGIIVVMLIVGLVIIIIVR